MAARGSTLKSRTNSSNGMPSSIQSKSYCTSRRVPRRQGTLLMRAGSTQTASSSGMGGSGSVSASVFMAVAVGGKGLISGNIRPGLGVSTNPMRSAGPEPSAASIARQNASAHETALPRSPSLRAGYARVHGHAFGPGSRRPLGFPRIRCCAWELGTTATRCADAPTRVMSNLTICLATEDDSAIQPTGMTARHHL